MKVFGITMTQAELISGLLIITGLSLWIYLTKRKKSISL